MNKNVDVFNSEKSAWERLNIGDPISDQELVKMTEETRSVIRYCEARGQSFDLMKFRCIMDLQTLEGMKFYRGIS